MPVRALLYRNLLFLGIAGSLGIVGTAVNWSLPEPGFGRIMLNMLAGLLVVAGLFTGWGSYLMGADRRALERLCRGERRRDGCLEAIAGTASTDGELLLSPLTRCRCIAYEYSIHRARRVHHSRGGGSRRRTLCFEGRHMADMFLEAPTGRVRIVSLPSLEEFICENPQPSLAEELGRQLAGRPRCGFFAFLAQRRKSNRENYHRLAKDWYLARPSQWDEGIELEERAVLPGVAVCAVGVWNERESQLETPYPWRFSRISLEPGGPEKVRTRIGEAAYQLARVTLWCLGLGYGLMLLTPLWHLVR